MSTLRSIDILRSGGKISHALPGYRERNAQLEMAQLVEQAIAEKRPTLLEASTGTGKSLGYLIPVVMTGKTAILSTGNKALQDQLFCKDIPFVQRHVRPFEAALMKGKGNYLCLDRFEQYKIDWPEMAGEGSVYQQLAERTNDSAFEGDFEQISFKVPDELKQAINVDSDACSGNKCPLYSECYYYKMREEVKNAQVVVVNHDLLLLDALSGRRLLPPKDVVVVDEAHNLEDVATNVFTTEVTRSRVTSLLALKELKKIVKDDTRDVVNRLLQVLWERMEQKFIGAKSDTVPLTARVEEGLHLASSLDKVVKDLEKGKPMNLSEKEEDLYEKMVKRAENLASDIRRAFSVESSNHVYYLKREQRHNAECISAMMVPLDVSPFLNDHFFKKRETVVVTSATIAAPDFEYFRSRVGMTDERTIERRLPLVFDYRQNALLYIPRDIGAPAYGVGAEVQHYERIIAERMLQLVKLSRGRAFLLFSSKRMLNSVYDRIASHLEYPLLKQGNMSTAEMTRQFRDAGNAVLFGLRSFWEGVDVAGDALSLVVIDKLPFTPPDDPVHKARRDLAEKKYGKGQGYGLYEVPQVIIKLKQGVGRLIRRDTDRGVMAILDGRMHTKNYARAIRAALPDATETSSLHDVEQFFASSDQLTCDICGRQATSEDICREMTICEKCWVNMLKGLYCNGKDLRA